MSARWSTKARAQQRRWLDYLRSVDERFVAEAFSDCEERAAYIGRRPQGGRPSRRWPGFRELLVERWRKLIVFKVEDGEPMIVAFYDQRQDLDRLPPPTE